MAATKKKRRPKKNTPGRITKLTEAKEQLIVEMIQAGNYQSVAADAAGISRNCFYTWIKRGRQGRQPYKAFVEKLEQAEAEAETRAIAIISNAAIDTWQAAAWYLERKHPDRWSAKQKTEISGPNGGPLKVVDVSKLTDAELERIAAGDIAAIAGTSGIRETKKGTGEG